MEHDFQNNGISDRKIFKSGLRILPLGILQVAFQKFHVIVER